MMNATDSWLKRRCRFQSFATVEQRLLLLLSCWLALQHKEPSSLRNLRYLSVDSDSLYLQLKPTISALITHASTPTASSRFKNVILRHHWHYAMQKNDISMVFFIHAGFF